MPSTLTESSLRTPRQRGASERSASEDTAPTENQKPRHAEQKTQQSRRLRRFLAVFLPAVITCGLTVKRSFEVGLWQDEVATWSAATRTWSQLTSLWQTVDVVHAAYYTGMYAWVRIAGESELALRAPSIAAMTLSAVFLVLIGEKFHSLLAGFLAGCVLALLPATLNFAVYARGYAISVFFAVLSTYVLLTALRSSRWTVWSVYAVSVILLGAVHLMGLLLLPAHAVLVLYWWREGVGRIWKWCAAVSVSCALLSPLALMASRQTTQISWVTTPGRDAFVVYADELFGGILVVGVLLGLALAAYSDLAKWWFVAAWAALPALLLIGVSYYSATHGEASYWIPRYLLYTLPAWALLAAVALLHTRTWMWGGAVILGVALWIQPFLDLRSDRGHEERAAVEYLLDHARKGDVAVYHWQEGWVPRETLRYYAEDIQLPRDVLATRSMAENGSYAPSVCRDAHSAKCLEGAERVWVVRVAGYEKWPVAQIGGEKERVLLDQYDTTFARNYGLITLALLERKE